MRNKNTVITLIAFCIWPLLTLIYSLVNLKNKSYKFIIPLFSAFSGYSFQVNYGSDAHTILQIFKVFDTHNLIDYIIYRFIGIETGGIEIYILLLTVIVKIFLFGDPNIFLLIQGLIVGYIISLFITYLYREYLFSSFKSIALIIYSFFFIYYISLIVSINGRFWTAYWVYILLLYLYCKSSDFKFLLYASLVILIHQGMVFTILISFVYFITQKFYFRNQLYYLLLLFSFIYSSSGFQLFHEAGTLVDNTYSAQVLSYTYKPLSDEDIASLLNQYSWFITFQVPFLFYTLIFSLVYFRFISKIQFNKSTESLYLFILLFISFRNFTISIPSLGGRYQIISCSLILMLLLSLSINNYIKYYSLPFLISFVGLLFNFIVNFRKESEQLYGYFWTTFPFLNYLLFPDINFLQVIYKIIKL